MKGKRIASIIPALLAIAIGFFIFAMAMSRFSEPVGGAVGIFFILLGFHLLTALRIAKLEEELRETKGKKQPAERV
jgi:hypothetical protein